MDATTRHDVLVIGGGQAGLAAGYHLASRGLRFLILDAHSAVGDSWRERWDSLRLFTPAQFDGLPGMPFPAPPGSFPTKDAMADYLRVYAERWQLPIRHGVRVDRLERDGQVYVAWAGQTRYEADQVVVATGGYRTPRIPAFASGLDASIVQLHSADYRGPGRLRAGAVLVVGAGNSGAEIAIESARAGHRTLLAGRGTGAIPPFVYGLGGRPFWFVATRVLTVRNPIGRKFRARAISRGAPLINLSEADIKSAGVARTARVSGVSDGSPQLADGTVVDVANVVWSTGFGPGLEWIRLPVIDGHGQAIQDQGVASTSPGLYFVGQHLQTGLTSGLVGGVGRDAAQVVQALAAGTAARTRTLEAVAREGHRAG